MSGPGVDPLEFAEARRLVTEIYSYNAAGCCWHVVLDDRNERDSDIAWVLLRISIPENWCGRDACKCLGPLLTKMTRTQRAKLRCL